MKKINGSYSLSSFVLYINTIKKLETIDLLTDDELSSFFHEYIHFIQNISTFIGLYDLGLEIELISQAVKIKLQKTNISHVPTLSKMKVEHVGDKLEMFRIEITHIIEESDKITIAFVDDDNQTSQIAFGTHCIMESMAHLGQIILYPYLNITEHYNDIPYHLPQKIVEFIYPEIKDKKSYLFSLCDASMMTTNPGLSFVHSIKEMQKQNKKFNTAHEIYNFVLDNNTDRIKDFSVLINMLQTSICENFNINTDYHQQNENSEIQKNINDIRSSFHWVYILITEATHIRKNNPYFLLDIIESENPKQLLVELINTLGYPIIVNENDNAYFRQPNNCCFNVNPLYWMAFKQVKRVIEGGKCEMLDLCNASKLPEDVIDECCEYHKNRDFLNRVETCPLDIIMRCLGII